MSPSVCIYAACGLWITQFSHCINMTQWNEFLYAMKGKQKNTKKCAWGCALCYHLVATMLFSYSTLGWRLMNRHISQVACKHTLHIKACLRLLHCHWSRRIHSNLKAGTINNLCLIRCYTISPVWKKYDVPAAHCDQKILNLYGG